MEVIILETEVELGGANGRVSGVVNFLEEGVVDGVINSNAVAGDEFKHLVKEVDGVASNRGELGLEGGWRG